MNKSDTNAQDLQYGHLFKSVDSFVNDLENINKQKLIIAEQERTNAHLFRVYNSTQKGVNNIADILENSNTPRVRKSKRKYEEKLKNERKAQMESSHILAESEGKMCEIKESILRECDSTVLNLQKLLSHQELESKAPKSYELYTQLKDILAHIDSLDDDEQIQLMINIQKKIEKFRIQEKLLNLSAHIRWMIRRDMTEVVDIETQSFEFPWLEDDFIRCLRQRNCIGMVSEYAEQVVGFMIYELHRNRLHILNFAVHPEFRRLMVGTQMVKKLIAKLSLQRRNRIMLEIRETNVGAQQFFQNLGFRAISLLREFYEDTPEDAYLMQYRASGVEEKKRGKAG